MPDKVMNAIFSLFNTSKSTSEEIGQIVLASIAILIVIILGILFFPVFNLLLFLLILAAISVDYLIKSVQNKSKTSAWVGIQIILETVYVLSFFLITKPYANQYFEHSHISLSFSRLSVTSFSEEIIPSFIEQIFSHVKFWWNGLVGQSMSVWTSFVFVILLTAITITYLTKLSEKYKSDNHHINLKTTLKSFIIYVVLYALMLNLDHIISVMVTFFDTFIASINAHSM